MIGAVARKLFGSANDRHIRSYRPRVDAINALEEELIEVRGLPENGLVLLEAANIANPRASNEVLDESVEATETERDAGP